LSQSFNVVASAISPRVLQSATDGALRPGAQDRLEWSERLLDRGKISAIHGQADQLRARRLDGGADAGNLV
jgi:hypothetical protein